MSMVMLPASSENTLAKLSAQINGIINILQRKLEFTLKGEAFALKRLSPIVSCHHGV